MKKKILAVIIIVIAAVAIVWGYRSVISGHNDSVESSTELTEIQELITDDLTKDYPASPRSVVNYYSRCLACIYNEDYTDEEFTQLLSQMRLLMDDDLLAENPEDTFEESMRSDAQDYKDKNWTISNYTIPDTEDVTYKEVNGDSCALLTVSYFIKEDDSYAKTYQNYLLRQDDQGLWKIMGYSLATSSDTESDSEE